MTPAEPLRAEREPAEATRAAIAARPGAAPPRGRGLRALVRTRLADACALEAVPPARFGFRFETAVRLFVVTSLFYRRYFRAECHGIERLPPGPVMLVANHGSHVLSWDGAMVVTACLLEAEPPRLVHGMAEHRLMQLPVLGRAARRIGAVDGRREACVDLLCAGAAVLTFPEGTRALTRRFRDRYRLAPFGHGFVHVAMATGAPIVPVAVIGPEEEAPLLANARWLARLIGTPVAPITPTLFVPLPVRYRLHFGEAIWLAGSPTREVVARRVDEVRTALAELVGRGVEQRRHVFR